MPGADAPGMKKGKGDHQKGKSFDGGTTPHQHSIPKGKGGGATGAGKSPPYGKKGGDGKGKNKSQGKPGPGGNGPPGGGCDGPSVGTVVWSGLPPVECGKSGAGRWRDRPGWSV